MQSRYHRSFIPANRLFKRSRGFTLIELMVTIAIAAILMAIATPSFTALINSNRLVGGANEVVALLQIARSEAIRRNRTVTVCASSNGVACADAGTQWVARTSNELIRATSINSKVESSGSNTTFYFRSDGFARATTHGTDFLDTSITLCVDGKALGENIRSVRLDTGSRISTVASSGDCS